MEQKPSVGRIVHYVSYGTPNGEFESTCRAAVITEILWTEGKQIADVVLCVLNPSGIFFHKSSYSEEHNSGTWHWPERV